MLHPARLGVDLLVLFLAYRNNLSSLIKYDETRTRGSLIDRSYVHSELVEGQNKGT
jgi:hypothetical protein